MPLRDSSPTKAVHDFLPDGVANARSSTTLHFHATVPRGRRQPKRGRLLAGSYPRGGYATSGEETAKRKSVSAGPDSQRQRFLDGSRGPAPGIPDGRERM